MKLVHMNLFESINANRITEVNHCLRGGANPKVACKGEPGFIEGWTPLHAAANQNPLITKVLLNHGANVNAAAGKIGTPLHFTEKLEVARLLLEAGADISAKNGRGETPLMTQKKLGHDEIVKLLESNLASKIIRAKENT